MSGHAGDWWWIVLVVVLIVTAVRQCSIDFFEHPLVGVLLGYADSPKASLLHKDPEILRRSSDHFNQWAGRSMHAFAVALFLLFTPAVSAALEGSRTPFITAQDLDLTSFLPPPPPNDSAQTQAELAEVLSVQANRTPDMEDRARADGVQDVWRFAEIIGPKFTRERLPRVSAFFERVAATEEAVVDPAKQVWNRPRPYLLSDLVRPVGRLSRSGGWPSGHATLGMIMGLTLSMMVPEKRPAIMARAVEYGNNRLVAGIHFRSDIEMGRIAGALIALEMMRRDEVKSEYELARGELRDAVGNGAGSVP